MNLLISGAWQQASEYLNVLDKQHCVEFLQFEKDNLPCDPQWVEGIIGNGIFIYHPIEIFVNLKYIQLTSAGFDRVPLDYVNNHCITINNARGVYSIPMAEFALAGVLQIYKGTQSFLESQHNMLWQKNRNLREIAGKNVAIIGCGSVGTACAKRFKAFDAKVTGVDIVCRADPNYDDMKDLAFIDSVLSVSDIIVITLPLTNETRGLFNHKRLKLLKDNSVIINIARGAVINSNDLIEELRLNRISAVLDVFEEEPLDSNSELWGMQNVIITPHNSFVGDGNGNRLSELILSNLRKYTEINIKE